MAYVLLVALLTLSACASQPSYLEIARQCPTKPHDYAQAGSELLRAALGNARAAQDLIALQGATRQPVDPCIVADALKVTQLEMLLENQIKIEQAEARIKQLRSGR